MSTIPTSVTEKQFNEHIRPHLTTAKRGYECKIPLYKVFNYILISSTPDANGIGYRLTLMQMISETKKSAIIPFTTIFASGAETVAWKKYGKAAS